jgi:hypothetical protein
MGLSTSSLPEGSNSTPKTFGPGNHKVKVNKIELEDFKFIAGGKHLILHLETEPIEGFEGFLIDKDNPEKGNYKGQVGRVKSSPYAYADGVTKTGIKVSRDISLLVFMKNLSNALGLEAWFESQDNKHDTVEEFIAAFNETAPFQDKYMEVCVAGKEYQNKQGYLSYDLSLAKPSKGQYSIGKLGSSKLMVYNEVEHLKKLDVTPTAAFDTEEDNLSMPAANAADFDLD